VIALPTDTVYGLAAHSNLPAAITRLYELKSRPRDKAIPLLLSGMQDVHAVAREVPAIARQLAERFWPGPLTLVLRRAPVVLDAVTAGYDTVAVRVPAHEVVLQLISVVGAPLAATSANLSGDREAMTAAEVQAIFGGRVKWILDGGRCRGGIPSTVVDVTVAPAIIRRRGALAGEIEAFLLEVA
jgi:L-threonylcarbamoyladenylate synthase